MKGGYWDELAATCPSDNGMSMQPIFRGEYFGFRVAVSALP
jgi:hypothetical protein